MYRSLLILTFFIGRDLQTNLIICTILFSCAVCAIFLIAYVSSLLIRRRDNEIQRIKDERESLLIRILFDENSKELNNDLLASLNEFKSKEKRIHLRKRKRKLLRQMMIDEMLNMKKNLSGVGVEDLYRLYELLGLQEDSYQKLISKKYQLIVMGIRELSEMNCHIHYRFIYRCTNHIQEDVRIEAQVAVVRLFGVKGLRFLSRVTYPISEWQQMTLLHLLNNMKNEKPKGIDNWLDSKNDSVIIFSLRLADKYNCFELLGKIQRFLHYPNDLVKIQSIFCLRNIYDENTEFQLLAYYQIVNKPVKLAVLDVLQSLSTQNSLFFLRRQLVNNNDVEICFAVLKVLHTLSDRMDIINTIEKKPEIIESIMQMLDQIEGERQLYS
jgi:hypothetical protein